MKRHPGDEFLEALADYKKYVALHPENLHYDPQDKSACVHLKQGVVAGGRLAAAGGKFELDGGAGLNIQAVKKVQGNWWLKGRVLEPDHVAEEDVEPHTEEELPGFCFKDGKQAPGILKNHIANLLGYTICLIPGCKTCKEKFGILIERGRLDANQVVNMRASAPSSKSGAHEGGWTIRRSSSLESRPSPGFRSATISSWVCMMIENPALCAAMRQQVSTSRAAAWTRFSTSFEP
jgi:hypothetical protein